VHRLARVNVLLVGSGGREHALAWKLAKAPSLGELHAAPGNPGIARLGHCHPVRADDAEGLLGLARSLDADLVVVGPEAPLVAGLADELRLAGISVFGPSAAAARIEGSKLFAKELMAAAGVPTASRLSAARAPCVLKADGLAAGKGVVVCHSQADVIDGLARLSDYGDLVVEELLEGEGPNTGGMGAYAPARTREPVDGESLAELVHRPVLSELTRRGTPFVGLLYAGLMLTDAGPRVLEFNCRFGDPETQAVLPVVDGDLAEALAAAAAGELDGGPLQSAPGAAVTVVLAAEGYPETGDRGSPIDGVDAAEQAGALVFHAGTALQDGTLLTNGGRILAVTGLGSDVGRARAAAYAGADKISFPGMRRRDDIALAAADAATAR
jgi:phosphoribosylamine---glycine ligase